MVPDYSFVAVVHTVSTTLSALQCYLLSTTYSTYQSDNYYQKLILESLVGATVVYIMSLDGNIKNALRSSNNKDTVDLTQDPVKFMDFVSDPASDLNLLANSDNVNLFIIKLLQQVVLSNKETNQKLIESDERATLLENKCNELKSVVTHQNVEINALSSRVLTLEQYSRRSTMVVTGVPFTKDENLEEIVCSIINDTSILDHTMDFSFISHVHRNKQKEQKENDPRPPPPPSITLQLVRAADVDQLFYEKKKFREVHGAKKVNIFRSLSNLCKDEKTKMESCKEVSWVDFRGHSRFFVVKMENGDFLRGVKGFSDLESKIGELTLPENFNLPKLKQLGS